ncbi:hypothetical protein M422DRAFT_49190 [Sphaerobolus stellatus SS14]|uniref:BTB domain-containing protein n=1 Tax=Sphaerobolus stellatus (strain SS14) TaxID=990650 RepID=A0A0C9UZC8_SPHS4|nr:hypothetical protein M422DRAFT_49190 [Sphaerobolus stellatus SS14]
MRSKRPKEEFFAARKGIDIPVETDDFSPKSPPYWHEDGDVTLSVPHSNQKENNFLVHRSILCLHSSVFRDIFESDLCTVEENEVISIIPIPEHDRAEGVRALLMVMYRGFELTTDHSMLTFEGALNVLQLTHKYQTEKLHEFIILINAARLTDTAELLPAAFYELAAYDHSNALDEDDSTCTLCPSDCERIAIGTQRWYGRYETLLAEAGIVERRMPNAEQASTATSIFKIRGDSKFRPCTKKTGWKKMPSIVRKYLFG